MNFHEVRFPANLSLGSLGGPERRTEIVTLNSGFEQRNSPWEQSRRRYDAGVAMRSLDDLEEVLTFYEAQRGPLFGFRWKDWADYKTSRPSQEPVFADQEIGVGDSLRTEFQLCKNYRSGDAVYCRDVSKPVLNTVLAGIEGVEVFEGKDFECDYGSGILTFFEAPPEAARVSAGFYFDVPVRFDSDRLEISVASFQAGEIPNVPVVEVRV